MPLLLERKADRGVTILAARGGWDGASPGDFELGVQAALAEAGGKLVVDLSGLDYMSSAGIGSLLSATRTSKRAGQKLIVCGLRDGVAEAVKVLGISDLLAIQADRPSAVAAALVTETPSDFQK